MADFFDIASEWSYFGIFLVLIVINAAPLLMPPTWIILSSFYLIDPTLDPIILAMVGATGATIGRLFLKKISTLFRRFVGKQQKSNLDLLGNFIEKRRFGYPLMSFLFAATPLPSNMLFVAYGLMKAKNLGLYLGFWGGRVISYYIMITISNLVLTPFLELFQERYIGILLADGLGIATVIVFSCIKWDTLLLEKKLKFIRPSFWR